MLPAGAKKPDFGVIEITAKTEVWRLFHTVGFHDIEVTKAPFPATPDKAALYRQGFQTMVSNGLSTMSLDRCDAMLAIAGAATHGAARSGPLTTP